MKKLFALVLVTLCTSVLSASAWAASGTHVRHSSYGSQGGPFGLGVVLGEPTGLSAKYWLSGNTAIDGTLAYSFNDFFLLSSDYLWHFKGAFGARNEFVSELTPYIGIGGVLLLQTSSTAVNRSYFTSRDGSTGLAVRFPLGIEWRPHSAPIGVFAELAPGLGIIPSTFGLLEGGVGARFYF